MRAKTIGYGLLFSLLLCLQASAFVDEPSVIIDCSKTTKKRVNPIWTRVNLWDFTTAKNFEPAPFIREVIIMTATGGRPSCEMFKMDKDGIVTYEFEKLDSALDNILGKNLYPLIVLGNTPEDLSDMPNQKGAFSANIGSPKDYRLYYDYIKDLFSHLVARYGKEKVASWSYRLMTEPDSDAWWKGGWWEYQKIYDYTVAAAREAVPGIVIDGGNLVSTKKRWAADWDDWITSNLGAFHENAVPRKVREISFSGYGNLYGNNQMGNDPRELAEIIIKTRQNSKLLSDVKMSVAEGHILHDEQGKYLWEGDGTELGSAWNAALFKVCHDNDLHRYVQWDFTSDGVKSPSYNVFMMLEKMLSNECLDIKVKVPQSLSKKSYIDAIASMDKAGNFKLLVFHYRPERNSTKIVNLRVSFDNLKKGNYLMKHWRIDKEHSNFFTHWLKDSENIKRVSPSANSGSIWDMVIVHVLSEKDKKFWKKKKDAYLEIDDLELFEPVHKIDIDGSYTKEIPLPVNSVSLIELSVIPKF